MLSIDEINRYLIKGKKNLSHEQIHVVRSFLYYLAELEIEEILKNFNKTQINDDKDPRNLY